MNLVTKNELLSGHHAEVAIEMANPFTVPVPLKMCGHGSVGNRMRWRSKADPFPSKPLIKRGFSLRDGKQDRLLSHTYITIPLLMAAIAGALIAFGHSIWIVAPPPGYWGLIAPATPGGHGSPEHCRGIQKLAVA